MIYERSMTFVPSSSFGSARQNVDTRIMALFTDSSTGILLEPHETRFGEGEARAYLKSDHPSFKPSVLISTIVETRERKLKIP